MSFVDRMVSATLLSSDLKLGHLLRSEAVEEKKNREGWNESLSSGLRTREAGRNILKMFTSCALYSRLHKIPTQVERTWVSADFLKTASACPCPSSRLSWQKVQLSAGV